MGKHTVFDLKLPKVSLHALRHIHVLQLIAVGSTCSRLAGAWGMARRRSRSASMSTYS